jgi:hypothetical protein
MTIMVYMVMMVNNGCPAKGPGHCNSARSFSRK